jgi:hypothetical protein
MSTHHIYRHVRRETRYWDRSATAHLCAGVPACPNNSEQAQIQLEQQGMQQQREQQLVPCAAIPGCERRITEH